MLRENLGLPLDITDDWLVIRAAWDTSITPFRTPTSPPPFDSIDSEAPFKLTSNVRYRRDSMGGILWVNGTTRYLNKGAAWLVEQFQQPKRINQVFNRYLESSIEGNRGELEDHLKVFFSQLVAHGAVESSADNTQSAARLYFTDVAGEMKKDLLFMPIAAEIEITNKCFRHCSYCAYESGPTPTISVEHELSTEEWLKVIDEFEAEGLLALEFTGGDPFVREDALELIRYADSKNISLLINSDLSVLKEHHLETLANLKNLTAVQTSLDGATAESCDFTRGPGGFKTLLRQMARLKEAGIPFSVGSTIHQGNYNEVYDMAVLVGKAGAASHYVGPMYQAGRASDMQDLVVNKEQWDTAIAQYMSALRDGVIRPADPIWYKLMETSAPNENPASAHINISARGTRTIRVDPLANAHIMAKLRQWHPRFWTVGNLRQMPLRAIWQHSRLLNELRSYPVEKNPFDGIDIRSIPSREEQQINHITNVQDEMLVELPQYQAGD